MGDKIVSNAGTSVDSGESLFEFSGDEYEDALSSDELEDEEVGGGRRDIDCEMFAQTQEMLDVVLQYHASNDHDAPTTQGTQAAPKKTRKPKKVLMWTDDDGSQRPILPRQSYWYNIYVAHPDSENASFQRKFRFRFRLPYDKFKELNEVLEGEDLFQRWRDGQVNPWSRQRAAPISLLLLASLRYLGRGWTFDDLAENTAISQEVIRTFFHRFIDYGSSVLYHKYVRPPRCSADARVHSAEYELAGLPGAIGSCDATHIMLERVSYRFRQTHLGFKMTHTARAYNITVNHRRQIMATTSGHPGRWNDKTLALFDDFMQALHRGSIMNDMTFELYAYDTNTTTVIKQKYVGAWLLVDNGYLAWPTTVPPIKTTNSKAEIRFSAWLESVRKDVECTFGILKGRWRILKTGIRLFGVASADKIFLTCCTLHNWLLEIDGLAAEWDNGVPSEWEGELGDHNVNDISRAALNLHNPVEVRRHDLSGMGAGTDTVTFEAEQPLYEDEVQMSPATVQYAHNHVQPVRLLTLKDFRSRLVVHFDIAYQRNEICWPRCMPRSKGTPHQV